MICGCVMKGDVLGSVVEFDKAIQLDSRQKACKYFMFTENLSLVILASFFFPAKLKFMTNVSKCTSIS